MEKILVFAGTIEGRKIAEFLNDNGISACVCVATEYGESLLPKGEHLQISHERLTEEEMEKRKCRVNGEETTALIFSRKHLAAL